MIILIFYVFITLGCIIIMADFVQLLTESAKPKNQIIQKAIQFSNKMGIEGLLKNLKQCMRQKNLQEYRGKKAAVDTYAWLHKIIKGPSGKEIVTGGNSLKYVNDCMRRVQKIKKAGVQLIMVFDGGPLPRKLKQQESRKRRRQELYDKATQLLQNGQTQVGLKNMIDSIDVSPDVAFKLIQELQNKGIQYIVAPYEADAQLAYLSRKGIVDIIITQDSDLLAFGAKKILYKLDFSTLNGQQIWLESIKNQVSTGFKYFTHNMFLSACIMAGCDYLEQIKKVGMKLAQKVIGSNHNIKKALPAVSANKQIPDGYEENFMKAFLTFRFQRVYCPLRHKCVSVNQLNLKKLRQTKMQVEEAKLWADEVLDLPSLQFATRLPLDESDEAWSFLGKKLTDEIAIKIAEARINPITFQKYDEYCLDKLRYNKGNTFQSKMVSKKSTQSAPQKLGNNHSIKDFIKVDKKNVLEYRSIKNREISQQDYVVPIREQVASIQTHFPIKQLKNKKALKFNDSESESDNEDEEKDQVSKIESIDLISNSPNEPDSNSKIQDSINSLKSDKQTTNFRNKLEEISETYFIQFFSKEFLSAPFS